MAQAAIRTATWNGPGGAIATSSIGQRLPEGPADGGAHSTFSAARPRELTVRGPVRKYEIVRAARPAQVPRCAAASPMSPPEMEVPP